MYVWTYELVRICWFESQSLAGHFSLGFDFFRFFVFPTTFGAFRENDKNAFKTQELLAEGPTPPVTAMNL